MRYGDAEREELNMEVRYALMRIFSQGSSIEKMSVPSTHIFHLQSIMLILDRVCGGWHVLLGFALGYSRGVCCMVDIVCGRRESKSVLREGGSWRERGNSEGMSADAVVAVVCSARTRPDSAMCKRARDYSRHTLVTVHFVQDPRQLTRMSDPNATD